MESASIPARPARARGEVVREFISKFGLIALLLVLPVAYGIQDLQDEGDLGRLATNIKDGLSNGAIWALIAIGYTLVYGIIELINFAHGDLFMIGSFIAYAHDRHDRPHDRHRRDPAVLRPPADPPDRDGRLRNAQHDDRAGGLPAIAQRAKLAPLITAVGFSFILQNVGLLWLGGSHRGVPDLIDSQDAFVTVLGVPITNGDFLAAVVTVPLFILLVNFISRPRASAAPCARPHRTRRRRG